MNYLIAIKVMKEEGRKSIEITESNPNPRVLKEFCEVLKTAILDCLTLNYNIIGKDCLKKIINAIKNNKNIYSLRIQGETLSDSIISRLKDIKLKTPALNIQLDIHIDQISSPHKREKSSIIHRNDNGSLFYLPSDVLLEILRHMNNKDLFLISSICKKLEFAAVMAYYKRNPIKDISFASASAMFNAYIIIRYHRLRVLLRNSLIEKNILKNPLLRIQQKVEQTATRKQEQVYISAATYAAVSPFAMPPATFKAVSSSAVLYDSFWLKEQKFIQKKLGPFDVTIEKFLTTSVKTLPAIGKSV